MSASTTKIVEEEVNFNLENVREISVRNNALIFGNTVYQISNISRITVRRWKQVKKSSLPPILLLIWPFFGALMITTAPDLRTRILVILIVIVGYLFYVDRKIKSTAYSHVLTIELNSGTTWDFPNEDKNFLERVAYRLHEVIQNPNYVRGFVANFVKNEIHNTYDYSFSMGDGDIIGSLINTGSTHQISAHLSSRRN